MPLPPRGSYAEALARANANSHFPHDQATAHPEPAIPKKLARLISAVASLDEQQARLLLEIARKTRSAVQCGGAVYAVKRTAVGWLMCGLAPGDVEHTVLVDGSACSCPQSEKLGRVCKHMEAIRCFCHVT